MTDVRSAPSLTRLRDEQDIRDLGYRFADACNRDDGAAFRELWTDDGVWVIDVLCDTAKSGLSCAWDLRLRAVGGAVSGPTPDLPPGDTGEFGVASGEAFARLTTTTEWDSFSVTVSPPTAGLQLATSLDGCSEPRVVYWMGPDAVHYGAPTDPVIFVLAPTK